MHMREINTELVSNEIFTQLLIYKYNLKKYYIKLHIVDLHMLNNLSNSRYYKLTHVCVIIFFS